MIIAEVILSYLDKFSERILFDFQLSKTINSKTESTLKVTLHSLLATSSSSSSKLYKQEISFSFSKRLTMVGVERKKTNNKSKIFVANFINVNVKQKELRLIF